MPTGVALHDPRRQLFDAAERILTRDGPEALTSRTVTAEAGCAKGVLHRHFEDFDAFLAELVLDNVARLDFQAAVLRHLTGRGTVAGNLTETLPGLFGPVTVAIVGLVTFRAGLRARLRETWPAGIPVLTDAAKIVAAYLAAERDLGRVAADADVDALAAMVVGTGHLLYAGAELPPDPGEVETMVTSVLRNA